MGNRYILQRLIDWLNKLSDSDLEQLSDLFSESQVRERLLAIIENVLALRRVEDDHRLGVGSRPTTSSRDMPKSEVGEVPVGDLKSSIENAPRLKDLFFEVFDDNNLFPSRREMLDAMNKAFNCDLQYNEHAKRGRRDLINKCWNRLKELPMQEQREKLRTLGEKIPQIRGRGDDYKELFRLLVNHE